VSIDQRVIDGYSTVELHTRDGSPPFGPNAISEGTLHAAGVLAALFQPAVLKGQATLVAIEEPETALHPAAAGALFDALTEACERVQVIVATQSDDLIDHDDFDLSWVRVVTMSGGVTVIGEIDEPLRRMVDDRLATLGELMRDRQLRPKGAE
jgi:predicted ATPase